MSRKRREKVPDDRVVTHGELRRITVAMMQLMQEHVNRLDARLSILEDDDALPPNTTSVALPTSATITGFEGHAAH